MPYASMLKGFGHVSVSPITENLWSRFFRSDSNVETWADALLMLRWNRENYCWKYLSDSHSYWTFAQFGSWLLPVSYVSVGLKKHLPVSKSPWHSRILLSSSLISRGLNIFHSGWYQTMISGLTDTSLITLRKIYSSAMCLKGKISPSIFYSTMMYQILHIRTGRSINHCNFDGHTCTTWAK